MKLYLKRDDDELPPGPELDAAIAAAEARFGTFPADYRRFLSMTGGGYTYPNVLVPGIPPELYPSTSPETLLNQVYGLRSATLFADGDTYGAGTPPGLWFIGSDPGGLEFLMALKGEAAGRVFCWYHQSADWGTDGNDETALYPQAPSFRAFIESLGDDGEGTGLDFVGGRPELEARYTAFETAAIWGR